MTSITKQQAELFRAKLVLLVNKYFEEPKSGFDIKNILEGYARDHEFSFLCSKYDENLQDYVALNMVQTAKSFLHTH